MEKIDTILIIRISITLKCILCERKAKKKPNTTFGRGGKEWNGMEKNNNNNNNILRIFSHFPYLEV